MIAEERGWKWSVNSSVDGGLYGFKEDKIPFGKPIKIATDSMLAFVASEDKRNHWWVSGLLKSALEKPSKKRIPNG